MKKKEKYIVYLHHEYIAQLCESQGIETMEERENILHQLLDHVNRMLRGEASQSVLMCETFINSEGKITKPIEIYNIDNGAQVKNLKELQRLVSIQKKRGFVELKRKSRS